MTNPIDTTPTCRPEEAHVVPGMRRIQKIHFVGIGGVGMCGIAEVLCNQGYSIGGSDLRESPVVDRLRGLGVEVKIGHAAENISGADVVVISDRKSTRLNSSHVSISYADFGLKT